MKRRVRSNWRILCLFVLLAVLNSSSDVGPGAAAAFDTHTNGAVDQATHDADRDQFEEPVSAANGLGPLTTLPLALIATKPRLPAAAARSATCGQDTSNMASL